MIEIDTQHGMIPSTTLVPRLVWQQGLFKLIVFSQLYVQQWK